MALGGVLLGAALVVAGCGSAPSTTTSTSTAATTGASSPTCSKGAASLTAAPTGATTMGSTSAPVQLIHGNTLAQVFEATSAFTTVGANSPTWFTTGSGYTLTLRKGAGLTGAVVACTVFDNASDNGWNVVTLSKSAPAGTYTLVMDHPTGTAKEACPGHTSDPNCSTTPLSGKTGGVIGWWASSNAATSTDYGLADGKANNDIFAIFYQ